MLISYTSYMSEARSQTGTWCESAGEAVLTARRAAGLTQKQLAERLGTSASVISQYENGKVEPTVWSLNRIIEACGWKFRMYLDASEARQVDSGLAERRARAKRIMRLRAQAHAESVKMWGRPQVMAGFQEAALRSLRDGGGERKSNTSS